MSEPVAGWTANEAWLFADLARRALIASLDSREPTRAARGGPFRVETHASAHAVTLVLELDAAHATIALRPCAGDSHRWRKAWTLELERGDRTWTLVAGGPEAVIEDAGRAPVRAHLRIQRRAIVRELDGVREVVPLSDAAFHRHTRQSTRGESDDPLAWMVPTTPELAPWWEIDLGDSVFVASIRVVLPTFAPNVEARLVAHAFASPGGEPAAGSYTARVEGGGVTLEPGVIARFVRVALTAPESAPAALAITSMEILAAQLGAQTLEATMRRAFALHRDRPLFTSIASSGEPPATQTYGEVWSDAMALSRSLAPRVSAAGGQRVFLCLVVRNRPEWIVSELAALERGYVVVPLSPDDPDERLAQVLSRTHPSCVVCELADVDRLAALCDPSTLLLACGASDAEAEAQARPRARFEDLIAEGRELPPLAPAERDQDELYTVLFTSGSTGAPKGAMRSYAGFLAMILSYGTAQPARHLSFQPLSHLSERMYLPSLLVNGATIAFSRGGAHLMDELRAFEPTVLSSVPRLYDVLHASYRRRVRAAIAAEPSVPREEHEARELARARAAFGGRLQSLSVGSAPVSPEVLAFLRRCFSDIWVAEGYGSTEVGTIAVDGRIASHVEVKLVALDGAESERGEIWVRTPHVVSGYLGDDEASALDADGFFATGDLGERAADGTVRVIGRLRNTVKLAQGEFVSAERIEGVLATAPGVDRVYVHARAGARGVSALVVADLQALSRMIGGAPSHAGAARSAEAAQAVLRAVRTHAASAELAPWEIPRSILVAPEPFTIDNGLATASGKLARGAIEARFGERLDALSGAESIDDGVEVGAVVDRVVRAVARVLGRAVHPDEPLSASGDVDSLATAEILAELGAELGREVPLGLWFESRTPADLAARLEHAPAAEHALASLADDDLALVPALDLSSLGSPLRLPLRSILLTGATGFLGAHLVEALAARTDLRVVCLVRGSDDAAVSARLQETLASLDIGWPNDRVRVIAGDLGAPRLASPERRSELEEVDAILHAGAMVSWLAPYSALRAPNVGGTLALLELATAAGRARPLHFVSTISTAPADGDEQTTLPLEAAVGGTPYGLSKWIAEAHVRRAAERGLPVAIYRPAMIAGHSMRGHGNPDDFLNRYMAGVSELGLYLDVESARIDFTPVDYVAAAITELIRAAPAGGDTYHLANVDQSPSYAELGRALCRVGARAEPASYAELRAALTHARSSRLNALASFFPEAGLGLGMGPWPCARTVKTLAALGVTRPAIDDAQIARYVAALVRRSGPTEQ